MRPNEKETKTSQKGGECGNFTITGEIAPGIPIYSLYEGANCNQIGGYKKKRKLIKDPKHSPRMFLWRCMLETPIHGENYYFKALQSYKISDKSKKDFPEPSPSMVSL